MSYLIFLSCFGTSAIIGFKWGVYRERLRQDRGRVAVLRIAQKYHESRAEQRLN